MSITLDIKVGDTVDSYTAPHCCGWSMDYHADQLVWRCLTCRCELEVDAYGQVQNIRACLAC